MTVARAHLIRIRDLLAFLEHEAVAAGAAILPSHAADELVWDGARVTGIRSASGDLARARGRRPHDRRVLALPRASRALRARPGRCHAVRRGRQHRRRTSDGLDAGSRPGRHRARLRHLRAACRHDRRRARAADRELPRCDPRERPRRALRRRVGVVQGPRVRRPGPAGAHGLSGLRLGGAGAFEARRAAVRHGADRGARAPGERADDRGARARRSEFPPDGSSARSGSTTRACRVAAQTASGGPAS